MICWIAVKVSTAGSGLEGDGGFLSREICAPYGFKR